MAEHVATPVGEPSRGFGVAVEAGAAAWLGRAGDAVIALLAEGGGADAVIAAMRASVERTTVPGAAALLAAWAAGAAVVDGSRLSVLALWIAPGGGVAVHAGDAHLHAIDGERESPRRLVRPHTTIGPALRHLRRVRSRAMGLGGRTGEPELVELALGGARRVVVSTASVWMPLAEQLGVDGDAAGAATALVERAREARASSALARVVAEVPRACLVLDLAQVAKPVVAVPEVAGGETVPAPVVVAAQRDARRAVRATISRLVRPRGALIVGDRGAGKSAVLASLSGEQRDDGAPAFVALPALTLGRALRGGGAPATLADGRVLVVDRLADALAEAGPGAASLIAAVTRGELQLVGAATPAERAGLARSHAALYDELAVIELGAPTADEIAAIAGSWAPRFARRHRVRIEPVAVTAAAELSARFPLGRAQPEAALFVLEQACLRAGHAGILTGNRTTRGAGGVVDRAAVVAAIADHARLPAELVEGDDAARAARFEQLLGGRIAGQPRAVAAVAGALVRTIEARRAATTPPRKPLASLLLLGPTGTGKTETARLFAEGWFLDPRALFAVDLSEYQDKESVHRLIGAPPGYLGHGDRTPLAIAMAERPRRVVLFDEIEKAHRDVLDVLLQLLDEGRLTTGQGETVRFDEAVVILTSNLTIGGKPAARPGFASADAPISVDESDLRIAVGKELRPELVGRLDALIRFEAIDRTSAQAIALAHLRRMTDALITTGRLAPGRLPALRKDVLARLAAHDAKYVGGAREVMRLVEEVVRDERASAPPPTSVHVVYPWHDGGREVHAAGVVADLAPGADPTAAADLILVHPAGASLLYVAQIGARVVALLGDDDAAAAIAAALQEAQLVRRVEVARGRVRGDVAGRPIGELVDKLLS